MMTPLQRIESIIKEKRFKSERAFALAINADPSYFAKVMKGQKELPDSMLDGIEEAFNITRNWILTGKGEKFGIIPQHSKASSHADDLITLLKDQNAYLKRQLDLSLGEIRHSALHARALAETNQDLLVEMISKQRRQAVEVVSLEVGKANGEKYKRLKKEGSFPDVGT